VARSNVSTSIKELQGWGLIRVVNVMGDRRDHFESLKDPWEMFMVILEERKKREIDPTLTMLRQCVLESENDTETPDEVKKRMSDVLRFIETLTSWYDQMKAVPKPMLVKLMKLGSKVTGFLGRNKT
jgi:DNA-binding transcriptional regulator GbsR (MarR family)